MLQSGMRQTTYNIVLGWLLALCALGASAQPVQGLIVKLKPAAQAAGREQPQAARERALAVAQGAGIQLERHAAVSTSVHLLRSQVPLEGATLDAALRRLRLHPDVEAVEPDVRVKLRAVPNDPQFSSQWHLQSPTSFISAINAPPAWDLSTGSSGAPVTVALLDGGVRYAHPDLVGRTLPGYDFVTDPTYANDGNGRDSDASDPGDWVSSSDVRSNPGAFAACSVEDSSWHGTFIAGQVAAATNNSVGVAGVSWGARILPVRVFGKCGGLLSDILDGMRWAAGLPVVGAPANPTPARVINLSFGGSAPCSAIYQDVIDEVTAAGALVVVAAGNEGGLIQRPADCQRVLTVAGVRSDGMKASYSNMGANVALAAPSGDAGMQLLSLDNSGLRDPEVDTYGVKSGTSFAAPLASGVAALMLSVNPALTPAQLIARMKASTRPHAFLAGMPSCTINSNFACNCSTALCGTGLLDARLAVSAALPAGAPLAAIVPVASAVGGTSITLDGRNSTPSAGRAITGYQWRQVSGPAVSIQNATSAVATVQLPAEGATFVFELVVTDSSGAADAESVTVSSSSAGGGGGGGGGGGSMGWAWGLGLWAAALAALRLRRRGSTLGCAKAS